ncbi:hypothetical protein QBC39DRAFT_431849 [Podospora conica]|nr:hypothetical protein QBC39DRAFT_431849 [Schizothecium conicum]
MKFTTLLSLLPALAAAVPQAPQTTRVAVPASEPHYPVHPGAAANCTSYYKVSSGDICLFVASDFGITVDQLAAWNAVGGRDCPYLSLGYYACVSVAPPTAPPPTSTSSGAVATPTPTQPGVAANCNKFHYLEVGDVCFVLSNEYGFSIEDFLKWNPAAGNNCSGLRAGYWACVGVEQDAPVKGDTAASG